MDRDALVERIRQLRPMLAESGVTHVAMFGSRARGDHRPDSDLDLLIEVDGGRKFSLVDLVRAQTRLGAEVGIEVMMILRRSLQPPFGQEIADDLVEIF